MSERDSFSSDETEVVQRGEIVLYKSVLGKDEDSMIKAVEKYLGDDDRTLDRIEGINNSLQDFAGITNQFAYALGSAIIKKRVWEKASVKKDAYLESLDWEDGIGKMARTYLKRTEKRKDNATRWIGINWADDWRTTFRGLLPGTRLGTKDKGEKFYQELARVSEKISAEKAAEKLKVIVEKRKAEKTRTRKGDEVLQVDLVELQDELMKTQSRKRKAEDGEVEEPNSRRRKTKGRKGPRKETEANGDTRFESHHRKAGGKEKDKGESSKAQGRSRDRGSARTQKRREVIIPASADELVRLRAVNDDNEFWKRIDTTLFGYLPKDDKSDFDRRMRSFLQRGLSKVIKEDAELLEEEEEGGEETDEGEDA